MIVAIVTIVTIVTIVSIDGELRRWREKNRGGSVKIVLKLMIGAMGDGGVDNAAY